MRTRPILLSQADIGPLEEEYALDALRSGWVAPLGPHVDAFEAELAARVGVGHALALASGTAALHLALEGVGVRDGRIVVVPSMTFAASANAAAYLNAECVFVDSGPDANLDPDLLLHAVRTLRDEGRDVAAVMSVDLFGRSVDYAQIEPALAELEVPLVEDAAEALGAADGTGPAGSHGVAATLSFNGNKIMTTSGGGMLLSDDADLVARARYLSTQARQPVPWYEHTEVGYNYRLSNVLAAIGRAQVRRLDDMIARRRWIRDVYARALADVPGVSFLGRGGPRGDDLDNHWLTCLLLDPDVVGLRADDVVAALGARRIEARHLWKPMHLQPVWSGARSFLTGTSQRLFETGVTLPSGSALTDAEVEEVAQTLREVLTGGRP